MALNAILRSKQSPREIAENTAAFLAASKASIKTLHVMCESEDSVSLFNSAIVESTFEVVMQPIACIDVRSLSERGRERVEVQEFLSAPEWPHENPSLCAKSLINA